MAPLKPCSLRMWSDNSQTLANQINDHFWNENIKGGPQVGRVPISHTLGAGAGKWELKDRGE